MSRLLYSKYPVLNKLFLVIISILVLDFCSVRYAWIHLISKLAAQMVRSVMPALASCNQVILLCDSWYPKKPVPGLVNEFPNLEMICNVRVDTVLYDLPGERTGKRGRPQIHRERIRLESIPLKKPEGADYYMGCREVITNLWKGKPVYAYVTAANPEKPGSFRLFLSTVPKDKVCIDAEGHADKKIRRYKEWGLLCPLEP